MHRMVKNTTRDYMFGVWSGLQEYNYQDDLMIGDKHTKNNNAAKNNNTL